MTEGDGTGVVDAVPELLNELLLVLLPVTLALLDPEVRADTDDDTVTVAVDVNVLPNVPELVDELAGVPVRLELAGEDADTD